MPNFPARRGRHAGGDDRLRGAGAHRREEVDGRADVYSLGCVLYECLVGAPPFRRDSELAAVFAHLDADPPVLSNERPDVPASLDAVVRTALAKEPERRYESCRELVRAALAVTVEEAGRVLADVASRAAAGRNELSDVEAELAGKVVDLQLAREQARVLSDPSTPAAAAAEGVCPFKTPRELRARGRRLLLRPRAALAGGVLPGSEGWRRLLLRPGERPLEELRRVLVSGAKDPLAEALDALPADGHLLLAVDQLEEVFTACRSEAERAGFAEALVRAATDPGGRAVVVVAPRHLRPAPAGGCLRFARRRVGSATRSPSRRARS